VGQAAPEDGNAQDRRADQAGSQRAQFPRPPFRLMVAGGFFSRQRFITGITDGLADGLG
jgi:hypothetical protein